MEKHIPNLVGLTSEELGNVACNLNDAILARKEQLEEEGRLTEDIKKALKDAAKLADDLACDLGYAEESDD